MARDGNRGDETGIAIAHLLRVSAVRTGTSPADWAAAEQAAVRMKDVADSERVNHVLDDRSVQALFDALPADEWVSKHVAAAYCQCSVLTLERRMAARWNTADAAWQKNLQSHRPPDFDHKRRYRWGFVRQFQREHEERPSRRRGPKPRQEMDLLVAALVRQHRFLIHADESIEAAWGQASLTRDRLIEILNAGGEVRALTAVAALASPWADAANRAPWSRGVTEAIASMQRAIDLGSAATQAISLVKTVGSGQARVRRTPL